LAFGVQLKMRQATSNFRSADSANAGGRRLARLMPRSTSPLRDMHGN
jgi:hypothetical protein